MSDGRAPTLAADQAITLRTLRGGIESFEGRTLADPTGDAQSMLVHTLGARRPPLGQPLLLFTRIAGELLLLRTLLTRGPTDDLFRFKLGTLTRVQRRNYFRQDIEADLEFSVLYPDEESRTLPSEWVRARTSNMSGGGLAFVTPIHFYTEERLQLRMHLAAALEPKATGTIVRVSPLPKADPAAAQQYSIGVSFLEITERDRDAVIRFLVAQRRPQRAEAVVGRRTREP